MKRSLIIMAVLIIGLFGGLITFAQKSNDFFNIPIFGGIFAGGSQKLEEKKSVSHQPSTDPSQTPKGRLQNKDVSGEKLPDHILYDILFRRVSLLDQKAKSQAENNETLTQFRNYFIDEAKLSAEENDVLSKTADSFGQEVQIVDEQAAVITEQLRQQYSEGRTAKGRFIQPTPELLQLQEQRDNLALRYRDQLKAFLGDDRFNEFDNFVKENYAAGIQAIPVSSILEETNTKEAK